MARSSGTEDQLCSHPQDPHYRDQQEKQPLRIAALVPIPPGGDRERGRENGQKREKFLNFSSIRQFYSMCSSIEQDMCQEKAFRKDALV